MTRCLHPSGNASPDTCLYLFTLARIRDWIERAEQEFHEGMGRQAQIGDLWVLSAELAYALDNCPGGTHLNDNALLGSTHHLRDILPPSSRRR